MFRLGFVVVALCSMLLFSLSPVLACDGGGGGFTRAQMMGGGGCGPGGCGVTSVRVSPQYAPNVNMRQPQVEPPAYVQCPIPEEHRVANRTGVQCVWASIETLGNWLDVPAAQNLTPQYGGFANPQSAGHVLKSRGVAFRQTAGGQKAAGIQLVAESVSKGRAAMVGLGGRHAVVVCHLDDKTVGIIDNVGSRKIQYRSRSWFNQHFDGWALTLDEGNPGGTHQNARVGLFANTSN